MLADAHAVLAEDPVMARLIEEYEVTIETDPDPFERLCVSIINQQLSTASANAVRERTFAVLDDEVTPERVLAADEDALREAGLSGMKVEYLQNVARAFESGEYTPAAMADLDDGEAVDTLTEITGVGEWTAEMYCIFVLGRPDVLPLGDLAIRNGIEQLYADGEDLTRAEMREIAEPWRPYRSVGARYVWAAYED